MMKKVLFTAILCLGALISFAQSKEQMVGTYEMSVPDKAKTTITLNADGSFEFEEQTFTNGKWITAKTKKGKWLIVGDKLNTQPTEVMVGGAKSTCTEKLNQQPGNCFKEGYLFAMDRIWTVNPTGITTAIFVRTN